MHTKFSNYLRNIPRLGLRLAVFIALVAVSFSGGLPVSAAPALSLSNPLTVGAQTGTLTAGTAGSVTFTVTVNRNNGTPANFNLSITGLPTGATSSFSVNNPVPFTITGAGSRSVVLTVNTTTATPGGTFTLSVSASAAGSQTRTGTRTLTINPGPPTITFGPAPTPTYLGGNFTVSATTNSNGALTYSAVSGPCALVSGATFSSSGAGICVVRASTAATSAYLAGSVQQSITIAPATPTINFGPNPYPFFPGGNFTVVATTNSPGALTYSYVSGNCTQVTPNGDTFTPTALGACVVQANTAATPNFLAGSAQQSVTIIPPGFDLYAVSGSTTLPDAAVVPVLGYNSTNAAVTQPGGPTLVVNQGDIVAITLHNSLGEATSLLIQGQVMVPDRTGVAAGGTKKYVFTADHAGTYLYEAGLLANTQHQVARGLYGALIVRPATANQAYSDPNTAYNVEAVLLLSELDPALNTSATPASFDMRNYNPKYWLINGKAYPQTDAIVTAPGDNVLLRYVNAGLQHHSMAVLGLNQTVIAQDGSVLAFSHRMVAETIAPGQTADTITTIPAAAVAGSKFALYDGNRLLRNNTAAGAGGMLTFLTYGGTVVGDVTGPTTSGLTLTPNAGNLDVTATVDDSASGAGIIQAAEYYIDSSANPATAMTASDGTFDSVSEGVQATITAATLASLSPGSHTLLVRGQDAAGNWGAFALATIFVDNAGPAVTGLLLTPNPSNGSADVALSATGDDSLTGNSNIVAAAYTIDGSCPAALTPCTVNVNAAAPIVGLSATIPASYIATLAQGPHEVIVRSQDALGNWGSAVAVHGVNAKNLLVDKTGPTTSGVSAAPNPSNGTVGLSVDQPVVRVSATFDDASVGAAALDADANAAPSSENAAPVGSNQVYLPQIIGPDVTESDVEAAAVQPDSSYVKAAEGFIDAQGANGTGFPFAATDGLFDAGHELGFADIPLLTINALSAGNHTIYVHAQDGAGNWGAAVTLILKVDKQAPTASGLTLTPAATNNTPVAVSASATDAATGNSNIGGGEFFIDDNTGAAGTGTAMTPAAAAPATTINGTIPATTLATLTEGTHTVYVRAKDAASNWSSFLNATLRIDRTAPTTSAATVTPNPTNGATTVSASVTASDNGGSGLNGGVYWIDGSATTTPVGAISFNGTTSPITISGINVSALTAGSHNLRIRVKDAAGNFSSVRSVSFTVSAAPPDAIFSDGFESPTTLPGNWTSRSTTSSTRLNNTTTAALVGSRGLQAQGDNTNYVQYDFGTTANPATATFDARFYFHPNGNTGTNQDIFTARTTGGNTVFRVRYRLNSGTRQVQIQVGTGTGNAAWATINNASNRIEVVWQSGTSLQLYVNGTLVQTLTANTNSVGGFRLGSVISGGNNTLEYFDAFSAKRSVSPLIGP